MLRQTSNGSIFFFFVCCVIIHHYFGYFGHYGYDDMLYAEIAHNFTQGLFMFDEPFAHRFPIILLTALSYSIFGVSDFSSALPSMIVTVFLLYLVYDILKTFGKLQLFLGLSLTLFVHILLFYSDKIMTDIYVAFFLFLSVYWVNQYRFYHPNNHQKFSFLFVVSQFLAFSAKETAVLILPLVVVLAIIDYWQRRNMKFWLYSFVFALGIFSAYLFVMWALTGNGFIRFEILSLAHDQQTYVFSYDKQSLSVLLKRIFVDLFKVFVQEGIWVAYIFILPNFMTQNIRKIIKIENTFSLYIVSAVVLLLSVNFMSISPFSYHPLPIDPRHSIFLIPFAAIAASFAIKDFLQELKYGNLIIGFILATSVLVLFFDMPIFYKIYLPLLVLLILFKFYFSVFVRFKFLFVLLFIAILLIKPLEFVHYSVTKVKYHLQREVIFQHLIGTNEKCYVFTDPMAYRIGKYYLGFDSSHSCQFIDYTQMNLPNYDPNIKKYLLSNWHTQLHSSSLGNRPFFARGADSTYQLVYENQHQGLFVCDLQNISIPELSGKKYLSTKNDFESVNNYWTTYPNEIVSYKSSSGQNSIKINEFSSTFILSIDTVINERIDELYFKTEMKVSSSVPLTSQVVLSVNDAEETYIWKSLEMNNGINNNKIWTASTYDFIINKELLRAGSIIKIYVWNPNKDEIFIDDIIVSIFVN